MPRARKVTKEAEADVMAFAAEAGEQTIADQASKIPPTLWKPGVSGNPRGRPPEPEGDLVEVLLWKLGKSGPRRNCLLCLSTATEWTPRQAVIFVQIQALPVSLKCKCSRVSQVATTPSA